MRLTKKDKAVLRAFLDRKRADSGHLESTGSRLDILGMGGRGVAQWRGNKIDLPDLGSRSGQTVQRALQRMAPPGYFHGADEGSRLRSALREDA